MPAKLPKPLTRNTGKPRLIDLLIRSYRTNIGSSESGATVAITLVVVLAVIAGTAVVAQRSFDGFLGSAFQGRAKDARLTAEAGTAFIISEWNRPVNRMLYLGIPMDNWTTSEADLKNQCTAPSPDFDLADAEEPTAEAVSFKNGTIVSLTGDNTRRFRLISAKFSNFPRSQVFTAPGGSPDNQKPILSSDNSIKRGFVELEVEGIIYQGNNIVARSTIKREFEVEPKCCNRSFGKINTNDPTLGNDSRECLGVNSFELADLGIVTGLAGGGLNRGSGSASLQILNGATPPQPLNQVVCVPPSGSSTCGGTYTGSTIWGYPDSVDSDQGLAVVSVRAAMYCCS